MFTQKDIAEKLNLSVSTVSCSLRNDDRIPAKTRARVLDLATRSGYKLPQRKRNKSVKLQEETVSFGVLIQTDDAESVVHSVVVHGVLAGLCRHVQTMNISLNVHYVSTEETKKILIPEYQPPFMRNNDIKGLILIHRFPDATVKDLSKRWPCVIISNRVYDISADYISNDDGLAMHDIIEYLNSCGHEKTCFVSYWSFYEWEYSRLSGYIKACLMQGKESSSDDRIYLNATVNRTPDDIEKHLQDAIKRGVTVFVCANDIIGYDVIQHLSRMGLSVPGDVSVTGLDAIPTPQGMPQLTTFKPAFAQMGEEAVKCLRYRVDNPATSIRNIQVQAQLLEGETVRRIIG